jgi:ABC-type proline/glycine betaine transport system substrate-binding protein
MTEPDDAIAWAIKQAEVNAGFGRAWHYKDVCHAYRAGHAARDAEVAALLTALRAILAEADTMAMTMRRRAVFEAGRAAADKAERRT